MLGRVYQFGGFRLDSSARVLYRNGGIVQLSPKAVETLLLLVRNTGEVVEKQALMQRVWPDTFVEEINLTRNISLLRKALGEDSRGREFIETVPKRGYRFLAPVTVSNGRASSETPPLPVEPAAARSSRTRLVLFLMGLGVAAALAGGLYLTFHPLSQRSGLPQARMMLAVLPVQNLSGDPEYEYISDGLTEELIAQLGNLNPQQLGVIARTSSMAYKKTDKTIGQIGSDLGVDYVLEGSLRGAERRMRVTAQLIRVRDQTHLWAHDFDGALRDVVGFQGDVALAIASQIHIQLTPAAGELIGRSRRVTPEGYHSYLRGRFSWNTRTKDGLWKSLEYFQQAIDKDPENARAYAGLADAYNMLVFYGYYRGASGVLYAKAAADKALERDASLAEAHAALAYVNFMWLWDWPTAEREFRRAIDLDSNYAPAHHWYALYLAAMGRQREAVDEIQLARRLDPLSPNINTAVGYIYFFARRYDQVIRECQTVLNRGPDFMVAHAVLGLAYEAKGHVDKAISEFQRAIELSGDRPSTYLGWLGHAYAVSGRRAEAEGILNELDAQAKQGFIGLSHKAVIYAGLDEQEEAIQSLRAARDQDDAAMIWLGVDPRFDRLRANPRFREISDAIGNSH